MRRLKVPRSIFTFGGAIFLTYLTLSLLETVRPTLPVSHTFPESAAPAQTAFSIKDQKIMPMENDTLQSPLSQPSHRKAVVDYPFPRTSEMDKQIPKSRKINVDDPHAPKDNDEIPLPPITPNFVAVDNPLSLSYLLKQSPAYQEWAPLVITNCQPGMAKYSAPCLVESNPSDNLISGQELVYSAFKLRLPTFANEEHKSFWVEHALHLDRMRVSEDKLWAEYPAFYGQNLVFANAMYTGDPPADTWAAETCIGTSASHLSFFKKADTSPTVKNLIIATGPDSWSMQHFLDRTTVVWSQAQIAIPEATKAETALISGSAPRERVVNEIYDKMVAQHLHSRFHVAAERLVFSCRAPLIHPFTMLRISEEITRGHSSSSASERNKIVYFSRSRGNTRNSGRRVLNEDELLDAFTMMLQERGRNEEIVVLDTSDFANLSDLVRFFRTNVKAIVGPVGGAFYNARYALPQTIVLEIMPKNSFFAPCFWEQARLHSQDYLAYPAKASGYQNDMTIQNIPEIVKLLRDRLGNLENYKASDALQRHYPWQVPQ